MESCALEGSYTLITKLDTRVPDLIEVMRIGFNSVDTKIK